MSATLADIAATLVGDVACKPLATVAPDASVFECVQKLCAPDCSAVLIVDNGELIGVFSERDLMARVDQTDPSWTTTPIREVMTTSPRTIRLDQTLEDALNAMVIGVFRHLPTMRGDGDLEGVVTILDILVHITEFFPEEFMNLPSDPEHEARNRWGG